MKPVQVVGLARVRSDLDFDRVITKVVAGKRNQLIPNAIRRPLTAVEAGVGAVRPASSRRDGDVRRQTSAGRLRSSSAAAPFRAPDSWHLPDRVPPAGVPDPSSAPRARYEPVPARHGPDRSRWRLPVGAHRMFAEES